MKTSKKSYIQAPRKPVFYEVKPLPPQEYLSMETSINMDSYENFSYEELPAQLGINAADIKVKSFYSYGYCDYCEHDTNTLKTYVFYTVSKVKNAAYDLQMKKYQKDLEKFQILEKKHKLKLKKYKKDMVVYSEWARSQEIMRLKKRLASLEENNKNGNEA